MKNYYIILGTLMLVAFVSGCEKQKAETVKLATPTLQIDTVTVSSATIVWETIENAASYAYTVNEGEEQTVTEPKAVIESLTAETEYTVKVKAVPGDTELYTDSEWATVTFTTSEEIFVPVKYTVYPMDPVAVMNEANLANSYIRNVSPSGNYAVGYDDQFGDPTSFIWDRSTGEYTILDAGENEGCIALDVNDEGIIVGAVVNSTVQTPAYMDFKNAGTWNTLPTHNLENAAYPGFAASITNSGLIGGQVVTELADGTSRCVPCVWDNYQLDQSMFELPENGDAVMYGCYIYSMSEDGKIMSGWQDWGNGSRSPAIWIDGKLTRVYGETETIDSEGYIYEGITWAISPDGSKATGYFAPDGMNLTGFIYDIASGEKTEVPSYGGVAFDNSGKVYFTGIMGSSGIVWENGETFTTSELFDGLEGTFATTVDPSLGTDGMLETVYAISDDGKVYGGSYIYSAFGSALQYPVIVVVE